jgi:surface antigen
MIVVRLAAVAAALALAGCQSFGIGNRTVVSYAASANGQVGLVGSKIAPDIGSADRNLGLQAEYRALENGDAGVAVDWGGGRGGVAGVVVPGPRYKINDSDCRQITDTVTEQGMNQTATATACRSADGMWRIID